MRKKIIDWKDEASSYYPKSLSLAILILLFSFLVSPKIEVKPYQHKVKETIAIDIPPEIKDVVKPPEEEKAPAIVAVIMDDDNSDDENDDIKVVDTIKSTKLEDTKMTDAPDSKIPSKFLVAEVAPVAIKKVAPKYPDFVKKMGVEGTVGLQCVVDKNGNVGKIEVIKSVLPQLDEEAKKALKQWKFEPAKTNGKPIAVWVKLPFVFNISN